MLKKISFGLFDSGETILGALVFSTFFPLFITEHIDTKIYSLLYGLSFLTSFVIALFLGRFADRKAKRKFLFVIFSVLVSLLCFCIGIFLKTPLIALLLFLLLSISHQQAFIFYNSLLLNFEKRGFPSGLGVSFGYVASAIALIFLVKFLDERSVYMYTALIFLLFSLPSFIFLREPGYVSEASIREVFRDRKFLKTILSILLITEVANTLIAMMGVYLREVYSLENEEIYRIIGFSALGGVAGGIFWGLIADKFGVVKVFPIGFILWISFLTVLPFTPERLLLLIGLLAGFSLSHLWTTSRLLILELFPKTESALRLSFLSLTERIASTTGLTVWSFLLFLTDDNFRLSAFLMIIFPVLGLILYLKK